MISSVRDLVTIADANWPWLAGTCKSNVMATNTKARIENEIRNVRVGFDEWELGFAAGVRRNYWVDNFAEVMLARTGSHGRSLCR